MWHSLSITELSTAGKEGGKDIFNFFYLLVGFSFFPSLLSTAETLLCWY